jgi:tryptophan-rich sensory protein
MKNIFKLVISIAICELAGALGSFFTVPAIGGWYAALNKPVFTPSGSIIGAVWTVLFLLMGISLYLVWAKNWEVKLPSRGMVLKAWNRFSQKLLTGTWREENVILIFAIQLALNVLWSFLFFALKSPGLAFFELLMLWVAIFYTIVNFYRVSKPAGYLLIPYIFWVTFAGYLNYVIWMMN